MPPAEPLPQSDPAAPQPLATPPVPQRGPRPGRLRRLCTLANLLNLTAFALFFAFVTFSNDFDWDHFLAATEVDRRAWVLDGEPPFWSYQFCGGVTRAGDPQSFGLSPLFAWVLAFGSFWGLKTGWLALAVVGYLSLTRLLRLFYTQGEPTRHVGPGAEALLRTLSLCFVLGNYYLWHAHHGHFTFALGMVALTLVQRLLQAWFTPLRMGDVLLVAGLALAYFSGGIYHSLVFFLLPLTVALVLALGVVTLAQVVGWFPRVGSLSRLGVAVAAAGAGLALGSYKLIFVSGYQSQFPRTVAQSRGVEGATLLQSAVFQLVPSLRYQFGGVFKGWGPYGIWEYSAFTLNSWLCVGLVAALAVGWLRARRGGPVLAPRGTAASAVLWTLVACLFFTGWAFSVGETLPFSLHRLVNEAAQGSIRVTGRYQVLYALGATCLAALLLGRHRHLRRGVLTWGIIAAPVLLSLNLLTFHPTLRPSTLLPMLALASEPRREMESLQIVRRRTMTNSFMYPTVLAGGAVLNCYNPLFRETRIASETQGRGELMNERNQLREGASLPLVDPQAGAPSEECRTRSYFTQSEVVLHPSCGPGTCVNINGLNPYVDSPLKLDSTSFKYCLSAN